MDLALWGIAYALILIVGWVSKKSIEKSIDSSIEATFSKDVAKYQDSLARASAARQFILDREMAFFELADDQLSDLIPMVQTMRDSVINQTFSECDKECYLKYLDSIRVLKRITLQYEPYISEDIYEAYIDLVVKMQEDDTAWGDYAALLSAGKRPSLEDCENAENSCEKILKSIVWARLRQIEYLKKISHR